MVDICKLQQMAATSFKKDATGKDNFHNLHTIGWPLAKRTVGGENFFLSNHPDLSYWPSGYKEDIPLSQSFCKWSGSPSLDQPVAKRTVRDDNSFLTNYPDHSYGPFGNKEEDSLMILFANDLDHPLWTVLDCKYFFAHGPDLSGGQAFCKEDDKKSQDINLHSRKALLFNWAPYHCEANFVLFRCNEGNSEAPQNPAHCWSHGTCCWLIEMCGEPTYCQSHETDALATSYICLPECTRVS